MAEWGLAPDYIVNNWTEELLELMVAKLVERKNREMKSIPPGNETGGDRIISDKALFAQLGNRLKVVKRAN